MGTRKYDKALVAEELVKRGVPKTAVLGVQPPAMGPHTVYASA